MRTKKSQNPSRDLYILLFIIEICHATSNVNPFRHYELDTNMSFYIW